MVINHKTSITRINRKNHGNTEIKKHATENQWVIKEIRGEIKKYLEINENRNIT